MKIPIPRQIPEDPGANAEIHSEWLDETDFSSVKPGEQWFWFTRDDDSRVYALTCEQRGTWFFYGDRRRVNGESVLVPVAVEDMDGPMSDLTPGEEERLIQISMRLFDEADEHRRELEREWEREAEEDLRYQQAEFRADRIAAVRGGV